MKYTECSSCQKTTIPITESIKIDGLLFCHACAQTTYPHEYLLEDKVVEQQFDPTICAFCKTDYGDLELPKTTKYPICADCQVDLDQRVFPSWVKAFFAGILLIVLLAFVWNWKYYQAYKNVRKANLYYVSGDYANATQSMTAASETVSEVSDLKTMATYFNGIDLLTKDKNEEALAEFNKCKNDMPADSDMKILINQATIGVCFDKKDYDGFLAASKESLERDTTSPVLLTSVASAYACVYVDKGQESAKVQSINYLNKAKLIDNKSDEMKQYYNMIEYRLDTKKIIKREDFIKLFPNGWSKN